MCSKSMPTDTIGTRVRIITTNRPQFGRQGRIGQILKPAYSREHIDPYYRVIFDDGNSSAFWRCQVAKVTSTTHDLW